MTRNSAVDKLITPEGHHGAYVFDDAAYQAARIHAARTNPVWARFEQLAKHFHLSETETVKLIAVALSESTLEMAQRISNLVNILPPPPIIITPGPKAATLDTRLPSTTSSNPPPPTT